MIRLALVEATDIGRARFAISDPLRSRNVAEASETAIHNIIFEHYYEDQEKQKIKPLKRNVDILIKNYRKHKNAGNDKKEKEARVRIENSIVLLKEYVAISDNTVDQMSILSTKSEEEQKEYGKNLLKKEDEFNCVPAGKHRDSQKKIKCWHRSPENIDYQSSNTKKEFVVLFQRKSTSSPKGKIALDPFTDNEKNTVLDYITQLENEINEVETYDL